MKKFKALILSLICLFSLVTLGLCEEATLITKGKYFTVYSIGKLDTNVLLSKLNFNYFLQSELLSSEVNSDLNKILAKTLDAIYLEVSDIIDIHMYNFSGCIRFTPDQGALNREFKIIFGKNFSERSFYLTDKNTIFISCADLTVGMLGHEMAHAIISNYFVVSPPAKVQEILSGYVEYNLRKTIDKSS